MLANETLGKPLSCFSMSNSHSNTLLSVPNQSLHWGVLCPIRHLLEFLPSAHRPGDISSSHHSEGKKNIYSLQRSRIVGGESAWVDTDCSRFILFLDIDLQWPILGASKASVNFLELLVRARCLGLRKPCFAWEGIEDLSRMDHVG